ncbi:hypothetical protein HKX48_007584 [Thoreauomyces humboldtii]|nr:hypothetical protein HKX48_007584 [Thoreauomyces humboldtii]
MFPISKFTKTTRAGIPFYTNRNKGESVMKTVLDQCTPGQVVVAHFRSYLTAEGVNKNYSEYGIVDNTKSQEILESDNQLFEIMMADRRIKVCFDIDAKGTKSEDPLDKVKKKIVSWFPKARMNIAGSRTKRDANMWKFSYHIVLQNYHVENVNGFAHVKQLCILPENKELGFDPAVYRTNGLFKFVNQSKGDGRVQKILRGSKSKEIMDHTILHNIHDESISVESMNFDKHLDTLTKKRKASNENTKDKKKPRLAEIEDIPRMNLQPPEELDIYSGDPLLLLTHMPNPKRGEKFQLSNWLCCKIARWCKTVGISFNDFWKWNLRKDSADSRLAKYREYWNRIDAVKFPVPDTFLKGCLISVYNRDILKSAPGKDLYTAGNAKHVVLHVPLGGNKSGSAIEYMNEIFKKDPRKKKVRHTPDGVENLVSAMLERYPNWKRGREVIGIHADRTNDKQKLCKIDETWGNPDVRIVIGNAALAVGVNYDSKPGMRPFDKIFGFFNPACISFRDYFQLLARVRGPLSNEIYMVFMKPNLKCIKEEQRHLSQCPMYAELCNIKLSDETVFALQDTEREVIKDSFSSKANMFKWDNIKVIDETQALVIKERLKEYTATVDEILQREKYMFRRLFKQRWQELNDCTMGKLWDQMRETVYAVRQFGKLERGETLFVEEMNKTAATVIHGFYKDNNLKFNDTIKATHVCNTTFEDIKKGFRFLHTPTTYRMDLYAKMINAYFDANIVVKDYTERTATCKYTWVTYGQILVYIADSFEDPELFTLTLDDD